MRLKATQERALIGRMISGVGADEAEATSVAEVMTEADLRGRPSRGLARLPRLLRRARSGAIRTGTVAEIVNEVPSLALIDGHGGFGEYVGTQAILLAIVKARDNGVGAVAVQGASELGLPSYFADKAARRGFMALIVSSTPAAVHPHGGTEPLLGTNPMALAFPTRRDPFLLEMATSTMGRGRILEAYREGKRLPPGCALTAQGEPTLDPMKALKGVLSPLAGPKGYGLGLFVSALAALGGGALGPEVEGGRDEPLQAPDNKGDFFLVVDTQAFGPNHEYLDRVQRYVQSIKGSAALPGFSEVPFPGERTLRLREERLVSGVEVYDDVWEDLVGLGKEIEYDVPSILSYEGPEDRRPQPDPEVRLDRARVLPEFRRDRGPLPRPWRSG